MEDYKHKKKYPQISPKGTELELYITTQISITQCYEKYCGIISVNLKNTSQG